MNELNVLKSMLSGIRIERNMLIRRTNKTEEDKNDLKIDELQIKALEAAISALSADGADIEKIQTEILEKMADYVASGYADSAEDFEEYSRIVVQTFNEHIGGKDK